MRGEGPERYKKHLGRAVISKGICRARETLTAEELKDQAAGDSLLTDALCRTVTPLPSSTSFREPAPCVRSALGGVKEVRWSRGNREQDRGRQPQEQWMMVKDQGTVVTKAAALTDLRR